MTGVGDDDGVGVGVGFTAGRSRGCRCFRPATY
jgi:hypothetical protein